MQLQGKPSELIPINIGFFGGQRYDENRFSGSFQYIFSHTSKKSVPQESFSMSSKDDRIATFFICRLLFRFALQAILRVEQYRRGRLRKPLFRQTSQRTVRL